MHIVNILLMEFNLISFSRLIETLFIHPPLGESKALKFVNIRSTLK